MSGTVYTGNNKHYSHYHYQGDERRETGKYFHITLYDIWKRLFAGTLLANNEMGDQTLREGGGKDGETGVHESPPISLFLDTPPPLNLLVTDKKRDTHTDSSFM